MIINKINSTNKIKFYFFLFFFILINYSRFYLDTYNLEWYFIELSKYFNNQDYFFDIYLFKQNQANTTFYSLFLSIFNNFAPSYPSKIVLFRFINFIPFVLLFFLIYQKKIINFEKISQILLLILFCPIITVYAFRIYPDFLSATLIWLSLILLANKNKNISILIFVLSFLIKPISIVTFPIFIVLIFKFFQSDRIKLILEYIFFTVFTYAVYLLYFEKIAFGSNYGDVYIKLDILSSIFNFINYYNYIILLSLPVISYLIINYFININFNYKKIFNLILISALLTGALVTFTYNLGEMNYGYISAIIKNQYFLISLIFINVLVGVIFFYISIKNKKSKLIFLVFLSCLLFLSVLVARPTQRYLMYLLPMFFFIIVNLYEDKLKYFRFSIILYVLVFSIVSYGQKLIQLNTSKSFNTIINYAVENNIQIKGMNPGITYHSKGYLFEKFLKNEVMLKNQIFYRYKITNCENTKKYLIIKKIVLFNINIKNVCLIENYQ